MVRSATPGGREPTDGPDPRRIVTRHGFGAELTIARQRSGLSVRRVANALGLPPSTVGGYFAGAHLPALQPPDLVGRLVRTLGITDPAEIEAWQAAYWRLRTGGEQADESPSTTAHTTPPVAVSILPPLRRLLVEPRVRGRDDIVRTLDATVTSSTHLAGGPHVHVLQGIGGSGKSMIALTLAQRAVDAGVRTFWIPADDASTTFAAMHALAVELGISAERLRGGSLPDLVWEHLDALDRPWLLVFDNADDPSRSLGLPGQHLTDGTGWLRPARTSMGTVVVTTRDGLATTWHDPPPQWISFHRVTGLTRADGADVLVELGGHPAGTPGEAADLAERLGGLPLALMLAGRYLAEAGRMPARLATPDLPRTFPAYVAALDHGAGVGMLAAATAGGRSDQHMVDRTWALSLALLIDRGFTYGRPMLYLLACLGAGPVPFTRILKPDILVRSPLFAGMPALGTWDTLRALQGLGLITLADGEAEPSLTLHLLVRDTVRADPRLRRELGRYLQLTTAVLSPAAEDDPKSPTSWVRWRLLADHCTAQLDLLDVGPVDDALVLSVVGLAARAAHFLRAAGHLNEAAAAFVRALEVAHSRLGPDAPDTLALEHGLARVLYDQGDLAGAEARYRSVLAARIDTLGPEHPDTLMTQHYLARTLRQRGALDDADALLTRTVEARMRLLGGRHPDTLTSLHGEADLLRARGRLVEARDRYRDVLEGRRSVLGGLHPATLVTHQYLAEVQHRLDDLDAAGRELAWLWKTNQEVRGLHHPRTLAVGQALVDCLHDSGDLEEAASLGQTVVAARRRQLGELHPATLASRHRLGLILLDQGRVPVAQRELLAVLADRQHALGVDHPHTRATRDAVLALHQRTVPQPTPKEPT
ncbi:tetratricopeptide repeat protein [Dactylosporangium aurantiacum]|uniref:Tetratricopeptide repeat protein n=1 Tax=Dactylosporangium aurantiacum TaxID=35754 RepID=A0A9Q9I961_9ACTN|nr:tetratricopeptide repeat protein [Dactylosporangium aurantiacum]MDG6106949.1 tetratricopeptide repeat protein [Dactylosporangium aurantiacum]UWZ50691.1 tetratricopeptide repeat protein [Dactylosporangium aurantiacum]